MAQTRKQPSRKGKRAWRKNVNIEDVEQGLESMRAEERTTGTALQKTQNDDLFQIDLKGDDKIRKSLPRCLTSAKILAQRSAVPAVVSRISTSKMRKPIVSREDKERLLRIAKRPRKRPLHAGLTEAVRKSGTYDPWAEQQAPTATGTQDLIKVPAVLGPHQGTSYNPPVDAHHELLLKAAAIEQKRVTEAEKVAEAKLRRMESRITDNLDENCLVAGMTVQEVGDQDEKGDSSADFLSEPRTVPTRKTKSQRNRETRLAAEKRALAERIHKKRLLGSVNEAKGIGRTTVKLMLEREQSREQRRLAVKEKLEKHGLVGMKIGKHRVPGPNIEVQLGNDLSESLRGLKTEGNLFHDRFRSLQQRGLIEPRVRLLPKRRKYRVIEYEKHAWKKFE